MIYRTLGKTGFTVSEISLGTWQVGGKWGEPFSHANAEKILQTAMAAGINFIDTADVYGDGESEKAVGNFVRSYSGRLYVATKCGRKLNPHNNEMYQADRLRRFVEDSLRNMKCEALDLIQLHCPPTAVYYRPEIFELFDRLKGEGKILNMGVSVEKIEEGLKAIEFPNVTTVQIIFNMFRQRPAELFFKEAKKRNVGIIVRVPLASGLLTGQYTASTQFDPGDHRNFNRHGQSFDKGETFAGIEYEVGLKAVDELKEIFQDQTHLSLWALRWILMFDEVSCVIPGASKPGHIISNVETLDLPPLTSDQIEAVKSVYEKRIKPLVHQIW
jgi:aryl-alcohol dehydrogenase-like predicted oxidoreductase